MPQRDAHIAIDRVLTLLVGRWLVTFFSASLYVIVKEALIEIGCVVTSLVVGHWLVGWLVVGWLVVGCHARALWPNGAS